MLAEGSKTICSNSKTSEDKKIRKTYKLRLKKQIDASINAMESTRVSTSLKRAFARSPDQSEPCWPNGP